MWYNNRFSDQSSTSGGPQKFHRRLDDGDGEISLDPRRRRRRRNDTGAPGLARSKTSEVMSTTSAYISIIMPTYMDIFGYIWWYLVSKSETRSVIFNVKAVSLYHAIHAISPWLDCISIGGYIIYIPSLFLKSFVDLLELLKPPGLPPMKWNVW